MQPRTELFRDKVQYFFDCAQEGWEMDSGSGLALELYGDEERIAAVIDEPGPFSPPSHYRNNWATCLHLAAMADEILPHIPVTKRAGIARHGLLYVKHGITELAETMSYLTIEDEIDGGCMEPYRRWARSRNGVTNKNTLRRLLSPKFIRRYVKLNVSEHADHLMALNQIVVRRARETVPQKDPELMNFYVAQRAVAAPRHDRMIAAAFPRSKLLQPPTPHDQRRIIKRSLKVATSMLGEDTMRSFLRGEAIRLIGQDTMLVLRKRGRLAARGHGCLSVAIADKNGATLADICTYIDDTPMLDQLTGFALWMHSGEERKIMETANITKLAEDAKDHPVIAHHYEHLRIKHDALPIQMPFQDEHVRYDLFSGRQIARLQLTQEQKRERAAQYWELTKNHWLESMMVAVIGYRDLPVYKQAGVI